MRARAASFVGRRRGGSMVADVKIRFRPLLSPAVCASNGDVEFIVTSRLRAPRVARRAPILSRIYPSRMPKRPGASMVEVFLQCAIFRWPGISRLAFIRDEYLVGRASSTSFQNVVENAARWQPYDFDADMARGGRDASAGFAPCSPAAARRIFPASPLCSTSRRVCLISASMHDFCACAISLLMTAAVKTLMRSISRHQRVPCHVASFIARDAFSSANGD